MLETDGLLKMYKGMKINDSFIKITDENVGLYYTPGMNGIVTKIENGLIVNVIDAPHP